MGFNSISLVIPCYQPGVELVQIIEQLSRYPFRRIIIVDDGNDQHFDAVLDSLEDMDGVILLRHENNLGKGAALKTAFRYILDHGNKKDHCVLTLDADGQHGIRDILTIAQRAENNAEEIIIGVRSFTDDVPFRSRIGNLLTRRVLRWIKQVDLVDTQSGLRCLPMSFASETLAIDADHYEFELECILLAKRKKRPIVQVPIETIYTDGNASSHFRPLVDSLRIYKVFARYLVVAVVSFLLDITLFTLIHSLSGHIIGSTYAARLLSGSFNFYFNKHAAFRSEDQRRFLPEILAYIALAVLIATVSGVVVVWLTSVTGWFPPLVKILVDSQLFIVSFLVQRFIIFPEKRGRIPISTSFFSKSYLRIFRPLYYVPLRLMSRRTRFSLFYHMNLWGNQESVSGPGSSQVATEVVQAVLPDLLKELDCETMLDVACGDWCWMSQIDLPVQHYTGMDIVEQIVQRNQERFADERREFRLGDITHTPCPMVDVILCRDCLVHFSFDDIRTAIDNIKHSGSTWLLATTFTERTRNIDILSGEWRPLNLQYAPFNFPEPQRVFNEQCSYEGVRWKDKSLALWKVEALPD